MSDTKQILVVDDHFEMLEFLRSMLELSNQDYAVLGVPSAEEGLFELRRRPFDLLITDVRLPGMSGFDLVRKVRQLSENLPVLMITAYATSQGRQEAEVLGVDRYFEKPLDTDALLAAVHAAIFGDRDAAVVEAQPVPAITPVQQERASEGQSRPVFRRLRTLLTDTGAVQIIVADRQGQIVARVGERRALHLENIVQLVAQSLDTSFLLGEELQSHEPFAIQYQAGESVDLYFANVGRDHFIILLFDVHERRGRIGTVWIFTQRAIKDLRSLLPAGEGPAGGQQADAAPEATENVGEKTPSVALEEREASGEREGVESETSKVEHGAPDETMVRQEEEDSATIVADPHLSVALDNASEADEIDLDAFWEEAAGDVDDPAGGLSFEEAMQRGLLPPEFGETE